MDEPTDIRAQLESLHSASHGWALACTGRDPADAADVLQQAYVKVLSGKARFEQRSTFKTWLFGVIRITALEHRRVRWFRLRAVASEPIDVPASEPLVDRETAAALARALATLGGRQREVLHLVFYEGLSIAEAATVMDVALGTARIHYERGKAAVLARFADEGRTFP